MKKIFFLFIIIGFLVYCNSLFNGFVWDDEEQVVNNILVHSAANIPLFFRGSTFNTGGQGGLAGIYYKPMMSVVFSFLYTFFGPRAFFFHFLQVFIHSINAFLLYLLFEKILRSKKLSLSLAVLFLAHPLNAEAVSYIAAYQDVLFFLFGLLALVSANRLFLTCLFLFLSVLSKETGIVFFAIVFLYYFFFDRKKLFIYSMTVPFIAGVYALLRFAIAQVPLATQHLSPITRVDLTTRFMTMPKIIFFYLSTFLFPKNLAISQHWLVQTLTWSDFYFPLLFDVIFFIILFITLFVNRKNKAFIFFFIWFIVGLGLHLQFFPLDMTVADRWFYFPMAGLLGISGAITNQFKVLNFKFKIAVVSFIFFLSVRTILRNADWKNGLTLFSHDIKISRDAFDLENNLGVELYRVGRINESKPHFEKSTQLAPYWWTNWNNLGAVYDQKKDLMRAEKYYKKAIDNGDYYLAYENYASILIRQKKFDEAKYFLENQALLKFPYNQKLQRIYQYLNNL